MKLKERNLIKGDIVNICMILDKKFPPDIRVEKEAKALIEAGHDIYLLSMAEKGVQSFENISGIHVIRMFPKDSFFYRLMRYLGYNLLLFRPWRLALERVITKYNINVVHVHDLPMVKMATTVTKKYNLPVIADLHENYPEGVNSWRQEKMLPLKIFFDLISPIWLWKSLEKRMLKDIDLVISVVEESKEHYVKDCEVPPEKIIIVMNTEDLDEFDNSNIDAFINFDYNKDFIISYVGGFGPHRGIDTAILAMPKILKEIPHAKLLLVGKGSNKYEGNVNKICRQLCVEDKVIFTGWVDLNKVPSYIKFSNVCLVPHHSSGHTNTTIPHKLFQYMSMEKPVIVTDCVPLKRIVEETMCGIVVPSGNFNQLAEAVIKLYRDQDYSQYLGENGRKAAIQKYNWKIEANRLCELYAKL